jgi:2-polyprenyl-3-methyl-5-hydroxy-6-metoxy-1,4-benzoquinol methylase
MKKEINYYSNARVDTINLLPNKDIKNILEIGGGNFPTLDLLMNKYKANGWGIDIYQTNNENIKFIKGSIEDTEINQLIPNNYFDLIVANDVVEHLQNTELFFDTVYEKLNKGGMLIISVPNIRQIRAIYHIYIRGTFPRDDAGLFDRTHLRWFCKADVIKIVNDRSAKLKLINTISVGRYVPKFLNKSIIGEFLGLQNIFLFEK